MLRHDCLTEVWQISSALRRGRARIDGIEQQYAEIEQSSRAAHAGIMAVSAPENPDRKTFALAEAQHRHRAILFRLFDDAPYEDIIWKMVRPGPADPFRIET